MAIYGPGTLINGPGTSQDWTGALTLGNLGPMGTNNGGDFGIIRIGNLRTVGGPDAPAMYVLKTDDNLATATDASDLDSGTPTPLSMNSFGTAAQGDYLYIGSPHPFHKLYVTVGNTNSNANNLTVEDWNGTVWGSVVGLSDGTDTGPSLGQTGGITWGISNDLVRGRLSVIASAGANVPYRDLDLYWVRLSWSAAMDASVSITALRIDHEATLHATIQSVEGYTYVRNTIGASSSCIDMAHTIQDSFTHTSPSIYAAGFAFVYNGAGTLTAASAGHIGAMSLNLQNIAGGTIVNGATLNILTPTNIGSVLTSYAGLDIRDQGGGGGTYNGDVPAAIRIRAQTSGYGINSKAAFVWTDANVAHGITGVLPTDVYGFIGAIELGDGGLQITGIRENGDAGDDTALSFGAVVTAAADTTHTAAALGVVSFDVYLKSGTSVTSIGANGNLFVVRNATSTKFIIDAEGDTFQDGIAGTAYDLEDDGSIRDDIGLLNAMVLYTNGIEAVQPNLRTLGLQYSREYLERHKLVAFDDETGHHFINTKRWLGVTIGAVRQMTPVILDHEARLRRLEDLLCPVSS